jgi:antitoxin VapB
VIAKVFTHNRVQAVYLPLEAHFPVEVKRVIVRIRGKERRITPVKNTWDHFFLNGPAVTADFFKEAAEDLHAVIEKWVFVRRD